VHVDCPGLGIRARAIIPDCSAKKQEAVRNSQFGKGVVNGNIDKSTSDEVRQRSRQQQKMREADSSIIRVKVHEPAPGFVPAFQSILSAPRRLKTVEQGS
jgi:hypothetical protein